MAFDWLFKLVSKLQVAVYRGTDGKYMASMRGMPVLLLTTVGRKTGQARTTPLMYIRDGESYVITASNNGRNKHPAWFYNLKASPQAEIALPSKRLQVTATFATTAEKERLWPVLIEQAPFFDGYRKKTSREIPMVVLSP